jgi:protein SCO1/2
MKRALAALACLLAACGDPGATSGPEAVRRFEARGVVQDVDREHRQVLIDHEDIPGLMPAMEMSFDVSDASVLAPLAPGQRIAFTIEVRDRDLRITRATVLEQKAAAGRSGAFGAVARDVAPDFALTDQNGAEVRLASLRGKTLLIDFIYTHCPGPCPILTGRHAQVMRELSPEMRARVHFVSITVDPERDTPSVLASYARARGADLADWSFLSGEPERVRDVLERYGIYAQPNASSGEVDHIVVTLLVDAQGRIAKRLFGTEDGVAVVKRALEETAQATAPPTSEEQRNG